MTQERLSITKKATSLLLAATALWGCSNEEKEIKNGCAPFRVYAQNRWDPVGTAVREKPDVLSTKLTPSFAPNEVIAVNGWIATGEAVYPTNPEPWNSDVWFRLDNNEGWVSFAGVRAEPTVYDATGQAEYGGEPVDLDPSCEI